MPVTATQLRKRSEANDAFLLALADLGGKSSFSQIGAKSGLQYPSGVKRAMDQLVSDGLIERQGIPRSPHATIALTGEGRSRVRQLRPDTSIAIPLGSAPEPIPATVPQRMTLNHEQAAKLPLVDIVVGTINADADTKSVRERIIAALCDQREWGLIGLTQAVRRDHRDLTGPREVGTILNSLNQQGYVTFRMGNEGTHHSMTNIKASKKLLRERGVTEARVIGERKGGTPQHAGDRTDYRTHGKRAEGGEVTVERPLSEVRVEPEVAAALVEAGVAEAAVEAAPPTIDEEPLRFGVWPELQAIQDKVAARAEAETRAGKLLDAAAALEGIDDALAEELLARAAGQAQAVQLTALEAEYLAYAEMHRAG